MTGPASQDMPAGGRSWVLDLQRVLAVQLKQTENACSVQNHFLGKDTRLRKVVSSEQFFIVLAFSRLQTGFFAKLWAISRVLILENHITRCQGIPTIWGLKARGLQ